MAGEDEYAFYARDLYLPAIRAEAAAVERAAAARDDEAEGEARASGTAMVARVRGLATAYVRGTPPPQVVADLATVEAELARINGGPQQDLWESAAEANDRLGNRIEAAYARMRQAEALLATGGDAAEPLRDAYAVAVECGAPPLVEACERVARRARLRLGDEPEPPRTEDPFGLTAREREVLVLVAAGRTNRQIGEELFMSEKTASVHVSRILAKLDVGTRGEAGAVAHKLGLDA
jgi:DNA-binding CsgD family transcriptional regulator